MSRARATKRMVLNCEDKYYMVGDLVEIQSYKGSAVGRITKFTGRVEVHIDTSKKYDGTTKYCGINNIDKIRLIERDGKKIDGYESKNTVAMKIIDVIVCDGQCYKINDVISVVYRNRIRRHKSEGTIKIVNDTYLRLDVSSEFELKTIDIKNRHIKSISILK